ncbi:MAG: mitochondrial fission ELM1 family protein, partial [Alphaproteobacteria bacterium]|nr:mitochondrial fission ELM1 family protein [Alphaproteobacteria bacterium]
RVAVLIGGKSKAYDMPESITKQLIKQLQNLDASLMVTCSRRTGQANTKLINQSLQSPNNFIWDGAGQNPYHAILAYADYILVTADSTSMISESCSTGKPVYMIDLPGGSKRISRFHNALLDHGCIRKFEGSLENFSYEPLNDAKKVAEEIKKRYSLFT